MPADSQDPIAPFRQRKDIDLEARTKECLARAGSAIHEDGRGFEKHIQNVLLRVLKEYLENRQLRPDGFVFYRSEVDHRPLDREYLRREVHYPALQPVGVDRIKHASGLRAFRRAAGKLLRKQSGLEMAAVQLGHSQMTTTDKHYNNRDSADVIAAANIVENAFGEFCPRP
jgi:integrase